MSSPFNIRPKFSTVAIRNLLARAAKKSGGPPPGTPGYQSSNITDTRYQVIKRILYETPKPELPPMTEEDIERHKTIERAWKLFMRNQREKRDAEMAAKYRMLDKANRELEKLPSRLFVQAQMGNKTTLFPKQMKVPTETPPLKGWNNDFKSS
ncbi:2112_t:CDS:1 [Acaulospora morrowiae]|uniref:Large ribosomal subunit protein mL40 n=1 Tax=Acaulospora morrowiae TaxID=94023 RepID=A0A9N9A723_9GLOM|nr:2112_t:CDS:1 [Acaulospora morrowiae]